MKLILKGKELQKGQIELYRRFKEEAGNGNRVYYNLILNGEISLTLNPDAIMYNIDGTGTIFINITDTYPKSYYNLREKAKHELDVNRRQQLADLLKAKGFEEVKAKQEPSPLTQPPADNLPF